MTRALISVSNKKGIVDLAQELSQLNIEIIASGGSKKLLDQYGVPTTSVEQVTGFPEILDGRVKTLHPHIHGGLLAKRDDETHQSTLMDYEITPIDIVIVNLYPFKETIQKDGVHLEEAIEHIDIGGPSMIRSAAKNYRDITVITDPNDYAQLLEELKSTGQTSLTTRQEFAVKAFRKTAAYDALISQYLADFLEKPENEDSLTLTYELKENLRYGENSHQKASFYQDHQAPAFSIARADQLGGKALSYNNIKDADAAMKMVSEFNQPAAVAVKHMNPCGIGIGDTIHRAFDRCYEADSLSIFGGIVALNRPVDLQLAQTLNKIFLEIIIAPDFDSDALKLLAEKNNLRLLKVDFSGMDFSQEKEVVSVRGGLLVQDSDYGVQENPAAWQVMTETKPSQEVLQAMEFAWKTVKHVKSNAVVLTNGHQTLGIGAGQMNRVGVAKIALDQMQASALDKSTLILASDAFIPMDDTLKLANQYGVKNIIQTGGSVRDQEIIDTANHLGMTMVQTGVRHFKH